jgi:hypothetical protein
MLTEAIEANKKALVYSEASHKLYDIAITSYNIANIYNSFKQYDSALVYAAKPETWRGKVILQMLSPVLTSRSSARIKH